MSRSPDPGGVTAAPAPPPIATPDVWDLRARPDQVDAAAAAWRGFAASAQSAAEDVDRPAKKLYDGVWEGPAADSFDQHRRTLTADVTGAAEQARAVAGALEGVAGLLRHAQEQLTAQWAVVVAVPFSFHGDGQLTFWPQTPAQARIVTDAMARAQEIRHDLDSQLSLDVVQVEKARGQWRQISAAWDAVSAGTLEPFMLPPEATGTGVIYDGNHIVVNTGPGDDTVGVRIDPTSGLQVVTVNGVNYYYPPGADIVIRAGEGNDTITVAPGTRVHLTVLGGEGNDIVRGGDGEETILGLDGNDQLYGGGGADRVSGGAGRDYLDGQGGNDILFGGRGDDTVYGLGGDDRLAGGEGQDYLEGATGNDTLDGGAGNDILSGGRDDDTIRGGTGDDVVYAGRGTDSVDGGQGADKAFTESGDSTTEVEQNVTVQIKDTASFITVEGSAEFKERVAADLDLLRASPDGAKMLQALQTGHDDSAWHFLFFGSDGDTLTIREYNNPQDPNNSTASHHGGHHEIDYNPHLDALSTGAGRLDGPPVAVLYHEMAHVYDYMNDTLAPGDYRNPPNQGTPNREREAVGLPIDEDHNPTTPDQIYSKHPYEYTEDGLRDEMGAPHRDAY